MFETEHEYWLGAGMMAAINCLVNCGMTKTRQKWHLCTTFRKSYLGILKS